MPSPSDKACSLQGGIGISALALTSSGAICRRGATLDVLQNKHPREYPEGIVQGKEEAVMCAQEIFQVGTRGIHLNDEPSSRRAISTTIMKEDSLSSPGSSGLRCSHLQAALCTNLISDISSVAMMILSSEDLPGILWALHTGTNLSALRATAGPVACGDVVRRGLAGTFCVWHRKQLVS